MDSNHQQAIAASKDKQGRENIIGPSLIAVTEVTETLRVDEKTRKAVFGKLKGLHSSYDEVVRNDIEFTFIKRLIRVETLTDLTRGVSVRADTVTIGPPKSHITWQSLDKILELTILFSLPFERISSMFGGSPFDSGQISRQVKSTASKFLPVYLYYAELIAESRYIYGDDTPAKVLEMTKRSQNNHHMVLTEEDDDLITTTAAILGRVFAKKDGSGPKKSINTTVLIARESQNDPESTIYFYRTHYGGMGNLLSKLLAMRLRKNKRVSIISDLSYQNKLDDRFYDHFSITHYGCAAHARRPFAQYADLDDALCDFMLRGFGLLSCVEKLIMRNGGKADTALKYRHRYSQKIWLALFNRSLSVVTAKRRSDCHGHRLWPSHAKLFIACKYIVDHFDELTRYIDDPNVSADNNISERLLRPEVMLEAASKFRKSEVGRIAIDILRTMMMTSQAAQVSFADYLKYIWTADPETLSIHPELFTAYAFKKGSNYQQKKIAA